MSGDWTWMQLVTTAAGLYTVSIALFLIRDNRSPQSTFAWPFLMLLFPIGGMDPELPADAPTRFFSPASLIQRTHHVARTSP